MPIILVSLNAHGLNSPFKHRKEAMKLHTNVFCIQETHFCASKAPQCSHRLFPYVFTAHAPVKKNGVLISISSSVVFTMQEVHTDPKGCNINNVLYTIVNLYVPNVG